MSGSSIAQWEIPSNQLKLAKNQAQFLNCPNDSIPEMVECLKKV